MEIDKVIVKVQMPLGGDMSQALVYSEDRKYLGYLDITQKIRTAMGKSVKGFFLLHYLRT